jgi:hypothetical protein
MRDVLAFAGFADAVALDRAARMTVGWPVCSTARL